MQRAGQSRRPRSDDQNIRVQPLSFDSHASIPLNLYAPLTIKDFAWPHQREPAVMCYLARIEDCSAIRNLGECYKLLTNFVPLADISDGFARYAPFISGGSKCLGCSPLHFGGGGLGAERRHFSRRGLWERPRHTSAPAKCVAGIMMA